MLNLKLLAFSTFGVGRNLIKRCIETERIFAEISAMFPQDNTTLGKLKAAAIKKAEADPNIDFNDALRSVYREYITTGEINV